MYKQSSLARVLREMEYRLFPTLSFEPVERVLYYFLFARTHLAGLRTVRLSLPQIAKATHCSCFLARHASLLLRAKGCVRASHSNKTGSLWEVSLPRQILGPGRRRAQLRRSAFDALDCSTDRLARLAILRRERGFCFYCLQRVTRNAMVLDHVVPRVRGGGSSFRNVVACCPECNFKKRTRRAAGFLRDIYRSGRLTAAEFAQRLAALTRLARGQLRISLPR